MSIILGVDPGSRKTGYGIIQHHANRSSYVTSGVIRMDSELTLAERLKVIFDSVSEIIERYQPTEFAIEQVFMANNASSALKLGQARGAAIVAAGQKDIPVAEYEARKIKQAVVGHGAADKLQVQHMVKSLLKLNGTPQEDAADALAVALCHVTTQQYLIRTASSQNTRTQQSLDEFQANKPQTHKYRRGRLLLKGL